MISRNFTRGEVEEYFHQQHEDDTITTYHILDVSLLEQVLTPCWLITFKATSTRDLASTSYIDHVVLLQAIDHNTGQVGLRWPLPSPLPMGCNSVEEENRLIDEEIRPQRMRNQ